VHERLRLWWAKMGRRSAVCQQVCQKIIKLLGIYMFLSLQWIISLHCTRNVVRKVHKSKLYLSLTPQMALHQEPFIIQPFSKSWYRKPLSSTTIQTYIHQCYIKLYCAKKINLKEDFNRCQQVVSLSGNVYQTRSSVPFFGGKGRGVLLITDKKIL